ncbi:MAG TPA: DNA-protecting protein DprA, partial [Bacteroidales bacterium]|nr:DNA-protecting protein DprA [Bacteroidales bacterium]
AVPGRVGDAASEGCNNLIKQNKAALITSAKDVIDLMRWDDNQSKKKNRQEKLFFDVSEEEKNILEHIQQQDMIDIDSLSAKINISVSRLSVLLLSLECKCYIECLPGKRYKLV